MKNSVSQLRLDLFGLDDQVVNVSSVPQRSPFRYPGGKTWLVPRIRQWLTHLPDRPTTLVEPFAGGAITSLTAAAEGLVDHVELVELDEDIASVWQVLLNSPTDTEWLIARIGHFEMTLPNVKAVINSNSNDIREKAFRTIIKNRVNRGGILAPGAGLISSGENGKGLTSRWYPETLQKRMAEIAQMHYKFSFTQGDALQFLVENTWSNDTAFFIDPPYTASKKGAGRRLYTYNEVDHDRLFLIASQLSGQVFMTYDDTDEARSLANRYNFKYIFCGDDKCPSCHKKRTPDRQTFQLALNAHDCLISAR